MVLENLQILKAIDLLYANIIAKLTKKKNQQNLIRMILVTEKSKSNN